MLVLLLPVVLFTQNPAFLVWPCRVLSSSDASKRTTVDILALTCEKEDKSRYKRLKIAMVKIVAHGAWSYPLRYT